MSLGAVFIITVLVIVAIVVVISGSFWLLGELNSTLADKHTSAGVKMIIFFPFLFMFLWCIVLDILLTILTIFIGYQIAKSVRDWWQVRPRT